MYLRKDLSAAGLIDAIRSTFSKVEDIRKLKGSLALVDVLMSGFALFSLKSSSLLAFDEERKSQRFQDNMKNLFGVEKISSDTRMREILDEIDPHQLRPSFKKLFTMFQRGKCLEHYVYLNKCYLIALDGTQYFSSKSVHCDQCLTKKARKTGEITYRHQMVGSVLIHPNEKVVLPLCPEPIVRQDGATKNDCERSAVSRWLEKFRKDHPKLKVIITEDGLSSNAPHIKTLKGYNCSFILGAKPGDHKYLFEQVHLMSNDVKEYKESVDGVYHFFRFINDVPLNESSENLKVNFLDYSEISNKGEQHFTWVTDIELNSENVFDVMRGGRARWKVENETFNTLKNQGYNFEHNYGHGHKNLSVIFALLMFLAFGVDQIQQFSCKVFQKAKEASKSFKKLWNRIRTWFEISTIPNWADLLTAIGEDKGVIFPDTS